MNIINLIKRLFQRRRDVVVDPEGAFVVDPEPEPDIKVDDPTAWMIDSSLAEVLLLHAHEVKLMAMFAYVLLHGTF